MHLVKAPMTCTSTRDCRRLGLHTSALQLFQLQQGLETKNLDKLDLELDFQSAVLQK